MKKNKITQIILNIQLLTIRHRNGTWNNRFKNQQCRKNQGKEKLAGKLTNNNYEDNCREHKIYG